MMWTKKSILASVSLCCLILFLATPPITADRAGTPLNLVKRHKKEEKKERPSSNIQPSNMHHDPQTDIKRFRLRLKSESRESLLVRSFFLACLFWTVKFVLPHVVRYLSRWYNDASSDYKRHNNNMPYSSRRGYGRNKKKAKPQYDYEKESTVVTTDDNTMSPSVLSLLELGNDVGDDDASVSTGISTFSSYFDSFRSYASRRRSKASSAPKSSHHHHQSNGHHTKSKHHHHHHSSPSKSKSSKISKRHHHHEDEGLNLSSLPTDNLYFIDEDHSNNGDNNMSKGDHSSSRQRHNKGSKELRRLESTGSSTQRIDNRYNHKNNDSSSSPLERKLASTLGPSPGDSDHINYNKRGSKETHYHKKNSNEGRHRHRGRTK